jgi:hypothetical protein
MYTCPFFLYFLDLELYFFYHEYSMQIDPKAIGSLLLGWFVPGLGHVYQKKYWKGGIFFVCILSMAALGLFMGGKIYSFQTENPLTILAFFSDLGSGFLFILSKIFSFGLGNLKNTTFEFGTAYIAGAGLLNYLVALDAFDIASGKKE